MYTRKPERIIALNSLAMQMQVFLYPKRQFQYSIAFAILLALAVHFLTALFIPHTQCRYSLRD